MAYNYASTYGSAVSGALSSLYASGLGSAAAAATDAYSSRNRAGDPLSIASDSTKYSSLDRGSSMYSGHEESRRLLNAEIFGGISAAASPLVYSWGGVDGTVDLAGLKRSSEALYHQTILGTHNTIGQSDALFSTNLLAKRPRLETASNMPVYPQRPGEKDCAYYMMTRTCKYGDTCKFDHPLWVPDGGIPDWKEVPIVQSGESLPDRPGEPDCPYYMKTQRCKFGFRCKFNHPKDRDATGAGDVAECGNINWNSALPERPSEPICTFYAKTGTCKFGATCKFHHPKDIQILSTGQDASNMEQIESASKVDGTSSGDPKPAKTFVPFAPALLHNFKGLPIRPGESDCPFYLKTGSCKYSVSCRYNHPERIFGVRHAIVPSASNLPIGVISQAANLLPNIDPRLPQTSLALGATVYPQRPGQIECDFYMKTGQCKFGDMCKFHHPIDRSVPALATKQVLQLNVKLTLAGLPRREEAVACPYYMKTGACSFGATCRFDHPPPGEAIAKAAVQGSTTAGSGGTTAGSPQEDAADQFE